MTIVISAGDDSVFEISHPVYPYSSRNKITAKNDISCSSIDVNEKCTKTK